MKKTTGITLATLGVLGVAGAIKFGKSAIKIHKNNNTAYPVPYEPQYEPSSLILDYPIADSRFIYKFHREAKNGNLKSMTEHTEIAEPEKSEEAPFNKCFTCDCEDDEDDLFAYYEECERISEYSKIAHDMNKDIKYIRDKSSLNGLKRITAMDLKDQLTYLLGDDVISDLVDIYRDHRDNSTLGFNLDTVSEFVCELRKRYTTKPEAGEYFEVMLEDEEHAKALQTLFEFLYEEAEFGVNRNDYVKDFIYKVEMEKLHVGKLTDETGNVSFEFYINDEIVAYGDEDLNHNEPTNEDHGYTLRVSFLDNVEELATKHLPNIMKHLLKDKHNFAKKALSEGYE